MSPEEITANRHAFRIETVFKVFLFHDDVTIQLSTAQNDQLTYLHIKSASRKGYSDLGVNRRRVAAFLEKLQQELAE